MTGFGSYDADSLISDLSVFADVGTDAPGLYEEGGGLCMRYIRKGDVSEIRSNGSALTESFNDQIVKHANFRSMLASDRYGALRDWANKQQAYFRQEMGDMHFIEQLGTLDGSIDKFELSQIDKMLAAPAKPDSARVLLIDGPAGIGKTQFIQRLAGLRANEYNSLRHPLILHVQSRGRTLSYIYDLMAFSLQRLRIDVTYDQIPILARHGLITVAIDGFDELADPDGYDLAWSQVNEFVSGLRGAGSLILAGRETFIGKERVLKDIRSLRPEVDDLQVLTLEPPTKAVAIRWLEGFGWDETQIQAIEDYLEPGSLALRPFFLKTLADAAVSEKLTEVQSTSVLAILMDALTKREIEKFGDVVNSELNAQEREHFVRDFMIEVARDMADNSSISISDATLAWLVDVALPKPVSDATNRVLKSRSQVLAFLTNDDRPGYRRFYHDKFYEYFLSIGLIETISKAELSKPLARNLFGSSLLETFGDIVSGGLPAHKARQFAVAAQTLAATAPPIDRTPRNTGALLIASLSIADLVDTFELNSLNVDEARFSGSAGPASLKKMTISQFDCRGADLSRATFIDSQIFSLIADSETLLPNNFPSPMRVQDISSRDGSFSEPARITDWLNRHLRNPVETDEGAIPARLTDHPAVMVLEKACRLRQYWLRRGDDLYAQRVLDSEWWPLIESTLLENNLLRVEVRQASGSDARFIHIRHSDELLAQNLDSPDVKSFFQSFVEKLME